VGDGGEDGERGRPLRWTPGPQLAHHWPLQEILGREKRGSDTLPASSIFVHDYLASRGLAQAPARTGFDGWADSMAAAPTRRALGSREAENQAKMLGLGSRPGGATKTPCRILRLPGLRPLRITGGIGSRCRVSGSLRDCYPWLRELRAGDEILAR
jgi:hypothetical protein